MRIRFNSDQIYENGGVGKGPRFPKGYVLDATGVQAALGLAEPPTDEWAEGFLHRWVQRGVADEVDGRAPVTEAAPEPAPAPPTPPVSQPLGTAKRGEPTKGTDADGKGPVEKTDYSKLTREELDALAKKRKVDVSEAKNKGDVIAALELADE